MQNFVSNLSSAAKASLAMGLMLLSVAQSRAAGPFTVNTDSDTHAAHPSTSPDDANANISLRSAIEAANAQTGATIVHVPAGAYTLSLGELDLSPNGSATITISGAGAANTVIKQGDDFNRVFNVDSNSDGGTVTTLTGLTIEGGTDKADNFGGAGILAGSLSATPMDILTIQNCTIQNNHCQPLNSSGNPGGGVSMEGGTLTISGCTFNNNSSGSAEGGGLFFYPQNVASSLVAQNSALTLNSITDVTGWGVGGGAIYVGSASGASSNSITGCTITGNSVIGTFDHANTYGAIQVQDSAGANLTISSCTILGNTVTSVTHTNGLGGGLAVNSGEVSVNFCRFFDNTADAGSALFSSVVNSASVNALNNWWGCNAGPGAAGCGSITGDGANGSFGSTVTFSPWIVLALTPSPPAINVGDSATLTASVLQNSQGEALAPSSVSVLDGLPISFDNPVLGSLSGALPAVQTSGTATVTFTAGGSPGTGQASATVDNATVTANIIINSTASLVITGNPTATIVCNGDTASFTAAATGTPTPTLQWQVSTGGGPFMNINGATSSPLDFTATEADNGNQYRAVFSNGSTVDSSPATLTVNAPPVADSDTLGTIEGVAVNAPVPKLLANDSSPIGGALSIIGVTSPSAANGTVVLNGQFITYTPAAGFFGSDSFTYTLSDTRCTAQGTVYVTVTSSNAPSLNKISITLTVTGRVAVFAGVPGVTYVVQWEDTVSGPWTDFADGTIVAGSTGLIQYTDSTSPVPTARFYRTRVGP
jgi:hypothetical protein